MTRPAEHAKNGLRALWITGGVLSLAIGVVGIVVPGLPTTVFLLLSSWMFARSSERLHRRLHAHPRLGPYLEMARRRRMPARARVISLILMWAGITTAISSGFASGWTVRIILIGAGVAGTTAIVSMRSPSADLRSA